MKNRYRGTVVWGILSLCITVFIISNSIIGKAESSALSSGLTEAIYGFVSSIVDVSFNSFHNFVRKTAHFIEFGTLGFSLAMMVWSARKICRYVHVADAFLISLTIAVSDEFIQSFTGRGSAVADVVLDFIGASFGILITLLAVYVPNRKKQPSKPN